MIKQLRIEHLAIIETSQIEFSDGFSVLTGETGAGKSIILQALSLLLGAASNDDLIQFGHSSAMIEGLFTIDTTVLPDHLKQLCDDGNDIVIWRQLSKEKSNKIRLNNQSITLKTLKELRPYLIEIMGQHEHIQLFNTDFQLEYLDRSSPDISTLKQSVKKAYADYQLSMKEYAALTSKQDDLEQKIDFLTFQINDIETGSFTEGEEDELLRQKKNYKERHNKEKLLSSLNTTITHAYNALSEASKHLDKTTYPDLKSTIESNLTSIDSMLSIIFSEEQTLQESPLSIDDIESRLDLMFKYKTKYHCVSIDQLVDKLDTLKKELTQLTQFKYNETELKAALNQKKADYTRQAQHLHQARSTQAQHVSQRISDTLKQLHFQHAECVIQITFQADTITSNGSDSIAFLISTNAGEPLKPIQKVSSGGELSRLMLALRTVVSNDCKANTFLLDEVDTGIGGHTAVTIGQFIKTLSSQFQVICITHLPQIAQFATHHYLISKTMTNGETRSEITALTKEQQQQEFSRMTGGIIKTTQH